MINLLKKMSIEVEIIFNKKFIPKTSLDRKKLAFLLERYKLYFN